MTTNHAQDMARDLLKEALWGDHVTLAATGEWLYLFHVRTAYGYVRNGTALTVDKGGYVVYRDAHAGMVIDHHADVNEATVRFNALGRDEA
jgi:hypothetical protein